MSVQQRLLLKSLVSDPSDATPFSVLDSLLSMDRLSNDPGALLATIRLIYILRKAFEVSGTVEGGGPFLASASSYRLEPLSGFPKGISKARSSHSFRELTETDIDLPSYSLSDLWAGELIVSVHLPSAVRLRFGLAVVASSSLGMSKGSGVGFLATGLVLPAGLVDSPLNSSVVAVNDSTAGLVGSPLDSFLVAARVFSAGLSDICSSLITELALPVALVDLFLVSFSIAVGFLPTAFFGGGSLATAPDFFPT